jgi:hypothetical protein
VDFVLCFAPPAVAIASIDPPPFGVWRFEVLGGPPIGWRSATKGRPSVRATLFADAAGERVVLQDGWLPVSLDYRAARQRLHDTLAAWPARAAAEIQLGAWGDLTRVSVEIPPQSAIRDPQYSGVRSSYPSDAELLRRLCSLPARRVWHWWREAARYDTWNVGIATLDGPLTDLRQLETLGAVRWLAPRPSLHYLADPFPYHDDGRDWLLVEEYGHPKGVRGRISRVAAFDESSPAIVPAITRDSHLSYPYTFQDGPHVLCAPEIHQEDGCIIYRLEDDGAWRPVHHVLRGRQVVDPTFFQHDGRWWLLCSDYRDKTGNLTLHGYHADTIAGPWTAHALNPLKSDLASARPAGRPFMLGGCLYRPAQDCSQTYGGAVTVMKVEALSPTAFRETPALRLDPDPRDPYPDGRHHLVVDGTRVYLDGKKQRFDYLLWWKAWTR